eukprot:752347-Hanusia_phi.AAC.3
MYGSVSDCDETAIVRIRGLPFSVREEDIREFFSGLLIRPHGIFFTSPRDGRPSGEAFVIFESDEEGEKALGFDRKHMGTRYVEVFKSSKPDLVRLCGPAATATPSLPPVPSPFTHPPVPPHQAPGALDGLELRRREASPRLEGGYRRKLREDGMVRKDEDMARRNEGTARKDDGVAAEGTTRRDEGIVARDEGILRREDGMLRREEGIMRRDDGIARRDERNIRRDEGNIRREEGITRRDEGISRRDEDILRREDGMLRREGGIWRRDDGIARREEVIRREDIGIIRRDEVMLRREDGMLRRDEGIRRRDEAIIRRGDGIVRREDGMLRREEGMLRREEGIITREDGMLVRADMVSTRQGVLPMRADATPRREEELRRREAVPLREEALHRRAPREGEVLLRDDLARMRGGGLCRRDEEMPVRGLAVGGRGMMPNRDEGVSMLSRGAAGGLTVKVKGLPYSAREADVLDFFRHFK